MTLPAVPVFIEGKVVHARELNQLAAAVPKSLADLTVTGPTGANQVLGWDGTNFTWIPNILINPVFQGAVKIASDANNYIQLDGASQGGAPDVSVVGGDGNIGLNLVLSGNGPLTVKSNTSTNNLSITPSTSTTPVKISTVGTGSIGLELITLGAAYVTVANSPPTSDYSNAIATTKYVQDSITNSGGTSSGGGGSTTSSFGSFTPTLMFGGSPVGFVQSGSGSYWITGNLVHFELSMTINLLQAPNAGPASITGLSPIQSVHSFNSVARVSKINNAGKQLAVYTPNPDPYWAFVTPAQIAPYYSFDAIVSNQTVMLYQPGGNVPLGASDFVLNDTPSSFIITGVYPTD